MESVSTWRSLLGCTLGALAVIIAVELVLHQFVPVKPLRELRGGIADLRYGNPHTLVLGSSHARTFHVLGEELARRGNAPGPLVAVPLENGKLAPYEWVLEHRLVPLIRETTPSGELRRPALRRFVLLTEWWDSCEFTEPGRPYWNLPGRAWTLEHYLRDVLAVGVDSYNRNYLDHQYRRLFQKSVLVQTRGTNRITATARARLAGHTGLRSADDEARFLAGWQQVVEEGVNCIGAPEQLAAFRNILGVTKKLGLETTVVLFPRKPATITDQGAETTLRRFRDIAADVAAEVGARLIDLTVSTPLDDTDFMDDYDHVNDAGNRKFAQWALENDLSFLLEPPGPT